MKRLGARRQIDINGLVARRGAEVGIDLSCHRRVNEIIQRIERGELAPSPALLQDIPGWRSRG